MVCWLVFKKQLTPGRIGSGDIVSSCFGQLVFFHLVGVHLFGGEVKRLDFHQILFEVLEHLHDFTINLAADTLSLFKQSPHFYLGLIYNRIA